MKATLITSVFLAMAVSCATAAAAPKGRLLTVESDPPNAHILVSEDEGGPWEEFRSKKGLNITPITVKLKKGEFFWLKLTRNGYEDSAPVFVRAARKKHYTLNIRLEPHGETATLRIDSEPDQAQVLVSESRDGDYRPWTDAVGEAITPARGSVAVSDSFWIKLSKKNFKDTIPEYVNVESNLPIHLTFDLAKRRRKVEAAAKERLVVTSNPKQGVVLVSTEEHGHYEPWPPESPLHLTPIDVMVDVGEVFWLKVRKDGYETTQPRYIVVKKGEPITIHETMRPVENAKVTPPKTPASKGGVISNGYAIVSNSVGAARNAAILDALGAAIQQKFGAELTAKSIANNYLLMQNRIESLVKGSFTSYDVLDEGQEGALYHVNLRVRFSENILETIHGENVTFLVGGHESARLGNRKRPLTASRSAAADVLMGSGLRVSIAEGPVRSPKELARKAQDTQSDMALYLEATARPQDQFGQFYSYKSGIDYQLVIPITGDIIATGRVEGVNKERQLNAEDAAVGSLRDIGKDVAQEVLQKLVERYDRAAAYSLFVTGIGNQRDVDVLVKELMNVPGVRDARLFALEEDICEIGLIISADARPSLANAIQRLRNIDLDVDESDLYTAVAHVR